MTVRSIGFDEDHADAQDLADRVRDLEAQCVELRSQLKAKDELLAEALEGRYTAYRQMVELERVRAFDEVARGLEHSLYNALTPVEGFTELMLMKPEQLANPAKAKAYLEAILSASKDARSSVPRLRELYYGTGSFDFEQHQSVNALLAKALNEVAVETAEEAVAAEFDTETLSPREWDVLRLLSDGLKNREIAQMLSLSENTVKTHIRAILSKLSLKNRTQAAAYALLDQHAYEDVRKPA